MMTGMSVVIVIGSIEDEDDSQFVTVASSSIEDDDECHCDCH